MADFFWWHTSERIDTDRGDLMPATLSKLESDRSKLLEEFLRLGDLRPGSITAVVRSCGKPTCHCAKPNDAGHDPSCASPEGWLARPLPKPSPIPLHFGKHNRRSPSSVVSRVSAKTWLPSTSKSVPSARSRRNQVAGPSRKKNGCCNPSGNHKGSKPTVEPHLCRAPPQRPSGSGGRGERFSDGPASSRRKRPGRVARIRRPGLRAAPVAVPLRSPCAVSGSPL